MSALLMPNDILSMTAQAARRVVEAGDGDCALLYLALLESGDVKKARSALHWGEDRLSVAYGRLVDLGLAAPEQAPVPEKKVRTEEMPTYSRQDIANAIRLEPDFCSLYREVERLLGRDLGDADLQTLYGIYDGMAMPPEVILLLVNHKIHTLRRQTDKAGAMPRMPQIRSEAAYWKRLGLDTVTAAEEYLRKQEAVNAREWTILSAVGITKQRPAVKDERAFIDSWVELGFSDQLIEEAYQRTVFNTGSMSWKYMDKILLRWHKEGLRTVEQVKAADKPSGTKPAARKRPKQEDYQPTAQRIKENDNWLDEFLRQQEKGE